MGIEIQIIIHEFTDKMVEFLPFIYYDINIAAVNGEPRCAPLATKSLMRKEQRRNGD